MIVGDLIVDETWYVDANKLSPEAPVPVAYLTSSEPHRSPGGAALAASYAHKDKKSSAFLTATNTDNEEWLADKGIEIYSLKSVKNVVKTRYVDVNSNYHLLRIDNDDVVDFPAITSDILSESLQSLFKQNISSIVMLDYRKGIFNDKDTCQYMINEALKKNIPTYVDTRCDITKFRGCTYLKLNKKEYDAACAAQSINCPYSLCRELNIANLIVTEGKEGAKLFSLATETMEQYKPDLTKYNGTPDVTGCGDVFDINFCYYCFQEDLFSPTEALRFSVDRATEYAYTSIGDRLC